jgi:hypothetical protein
LSGFPTATFTEQKLPYGYTVPKGGSVLLIHMNCCCFVLTNYAIMLSYCLQFVSQVVVLISHASAFVMIKKCTYVYFFQRRRRHSALVIFFPALSLIVADVFSD